MGNRTATPLPTIPQTCQGYTNDPLAESPTPPTTPSAQQHAHLSASTPTSQQVTPLAANAANTVSHAEWDECMRQSILTIGSTTITAVAAGLMVPAAETLLLLGTGIGVLWSIKLCRTLMRDGIISPEESKALEHQKMTQREERKRQRMMEKETKQNAAVERKFEEKQENKKGTAKDKSSEECCTKPGQSLEQKGSRSDDKVGCSKLSRKNDKIHHEGAKAVIIGSQLVEDLRPHVLTIQDDQLSESKNEVSYTIEEGEYSKIQQETPDTVKVNPQQQLEPSGAEKNASKTKILVKQSDTEMYSTVKLFAPYSQYLSESVIITCGRKECNCNAYEDYPSCTCDSQHTSLGQPQHYTLATNAEANAPSKDGTNRLFIHQNNANATDVEEPGIISEDEVSEQGNSLNSNNDIPMQPVIEVDQRNVKESEEAEADVEVIRPKAFDNIESQDDDIIDITFEDDEVLDIKKEDSQDGFDIEVMRNDVNDDQIEKLRNEMAFAETFKSESWPFSFSLPSLDKFSKKKNNSFKWPPLTSSIIVKPKKEPTCKCSDGFGAPKDSGGAQ